MEKILILLPIFSILIVVYLANPGEPRFMLPFIPMIIILFSIALSEFEKSKAFCKVKKIFD